MTGRRRRCPIRSLPFRAEIFIAIVSIAGLVPLGIADEGASGGKSGEQNRPRLRYPVALAVSSVEANILLSANERSGSISVIDLSGQRVLSEWPIGERLSDLAAVRGRPGDIFVSTDVATHRLQLVQRRGKELKVVDSVQVDPFPVSVCCDKEGQRCFVASLWSRRLNIVELARTPQGGLKFGKSDGLSLPFAPRLQILRPDSTVLVVADAFGGKLAVIDVPESRLRTVKTIPGHNIRGLAWSADGRRLIVSHQTLNPLAYTTAVDVHWGSVVSNVLRSLDRDALENPAKDVLTRSRLFQLGDVGNGAGDPASLAVTKDGTVYVALAGIGEVAAGRLETADFRRLHVGIHPTALATSADGSELYVADTFGDSVTIIKWNQYHSNVGEPVRISLGPQPPLSAVNRGERLFFDAHLSHDNWMSCHSCHTDGQSSDGLADTLGDGSFGAPKRIPSLGGVSQTAPWTWNGSVRDLAEQVRKSLRTTMHAKLVTDEQVRDLTEYLKSLEPAPPIDWISDPDGRSAVDRGRGVFLAVAAKVAMFRRRTRRTGLTTSDCGTKWAIGSSTRRHCAAWANGRPCFTTAAPPR